MRAAVAWAARWLTGAVGGPARFQVIAVLACVLALDAADKGTVGAVAVELKESLGISNTELGSLTAVSSASAALAVIPLGVLTDRVRRVRLLTAGVVLWVLAMLAGGLADSYEWLLLSRLALGAVSATAGPTLSSLIGDFFPRANEPVSTGSSSAERCSAPGSACSWAAIWRTCCHGVPRSSCSRCSGRSSRS
ncbi:hypothetical protein GCM10027612_61450 [Microbispora bryophytorum subsp. camponoti]